METLGIVPKNGSVLSHFPRLDLSALTLHLNASHMHFPNQEDLYQQLHPIKLAASHLLQSISFPQGIGILIAVVLILSSLLQNKRPKPPNAPYHGYRWWEPTFLLQMRFIFRAKQIITSGFQKYKNEPFVVRRVDVDITILPNKYLDELRLYPTSKLSGVKAHVANLVCDYTYTNIMIESDLHFRVIQNKLAPELSKYLDIAKTELEYGWPLDIPQPDDWQEIDIQQMMRMLVARMSSKIFLGHLACRNLEWLKLSIDFSIDMFGTAFFLRMFPPWTHPVLARLFPLRWKIKRNLNNATKIIAPLMDKHRDALKRAEKGEVVEEDDTLLNWMMDHGNEKENGHFEMANRQSILTLASIHTTSMGVANMLFDLCAHPEWFTVLREEIETIEKEFGKLGERADIGTKQWLPRLEKMDSFYIESQRFNPPILLAPSRLAMVPITLKDGTHIPAGTRMACANADILSSTVLDPETFDPMRSYRKRHETGQLLKHQAGQTAIDNLHFGYGKQACPGRQFAVAEVKMIMSRLLMEYEFKFPDGKGRPRNFYADENLFPDPRGRVMMRKRRMACEACGRS